MTLTQSLTAVIFFWAIIGGLGASLLLPAMQSLIHGNFTGAAQKRTYALVGASAAIAAAVGPLLGGFVTTYLSWRVGFGLEVVIILVVLSQIRLVKDVPYTGPRKVDLVGAVLSVVGMGGVVLGILVWQEGGESVGVFIAVGAVALVLFALAYYNASGVWLVPLWMVAIFAVVGHDAVLSAYGSELFPTSHRSTAAAARMIVATLSGSLGLVLESVLYGVTGSHWHAVSLLLLVAIGSPVVIALAFPETAGKSLEEISPERDETVIGGNHGTAHAHR
jgi:MFS family permease